VASPSDGEREIMPGQIEQQPRRRGYTPAPAGRSVTATAAIPILAPEKVNALAWLSLALSVIGLFGIASLAGVIVGIVSLRQIRRRGQRGRGLAIAGVVIGTVLPVAAVVVVAWAFATRTVPVHPW
jgi:hypothetical protein